MKIFIDTETTGLPKRRRAPYTDVSNWPRLVQLAWVVVDANGRELSAVERIVRPDGFSIPTEAANIHGITTDMAKRKGVKLADILLEFAAALEQSRIVVAHNIDYDRPVLEAEFLRSGMKCFLGNKQLICTKNTSTDYCALPGRYRYKWPTLDELHQKLFNAPMGAAHNALVDVRACMKCFFELEKRGVIKTSHSSSSEERSQSDPNSCSDDAEELLHEVIELAEEHNWFDRKFVDSLAKQYEERGSLTDRQIKAVKNIRDMLLSR
jgi:DNA polymerase III epsilon subunit-like protein